MPKNKSQYFVVGAVATALAAAAALPAAKATTFAGNTIYYEYKANSCNGSNACNIAKYATVPNNKLLIITRVSCSIELTGNSGFQGVSIGKRIAATNGMTIPVQFLDPGVPIGEDATKFQYQFNNETFLPLEAGSEPLVSVLALSGTTKVQLACTLAGTLQND